MYKTSKTFTFSASHMLETLPDGHPCKRLHGHNYIVLLELKASELNEHGFVVDYGNLLDFKRYIDHNLDHRHLNEVFDFSPTAENLALHLYKIAKAGFPLVSSVAVSETPKTWAVYKEDE